jgi:acetolactate synthase-1/2/3 large subunit
MTSVRLVDRIAELIERAGVRHVFGVGGANIEDMFAAIERRRPRLRVVLAKHEHGAGTAADASARIGGGVGVVLATSGGGALNLVHSLAEARASSVPILAIVGEPPQELQGHGAFQDTSGRGGAVDAAAVFRAVSSWCVRPESASETPSLVQRALTTALDQRGPVVLLLAKNLQQAEVDGTPGNDDVEPASAVPAVADDLERAVQLLAAGPVLVIAGDQVARGHARGELARLVDLLDASVAVTPDARDAFDNASSRFIGVAGAMGHRQVVERAGMAAACVLAGTRMPLLARLGLEGVLSRIPVLSLGRGRPFIELKGGAHIEGEIGGLLRAIRLRVAGGRARTPLTVTHRADPDLPRQSGAFNSETALSRISSELPEGAVIVVDAGNTGASAVHYLSVPRGGRWLLAMGMAGMGYAFGAAVGAACATGRRCLVCAGDGAFFMHGSEIHTAVEHSLPITFAIFNNRAHGMCLLRERLLLREEHQYNSFKPAHVGAGLAALFPGLPAYDCRTLAELDQALARTRQAPGPVLLGIELEGVEIPPFAAFAPRSPTPSDLLRGDQRS